MRIRILSILLLLMVTVSTMIPISADSSIQRQELFSNSWQYGGTIPPPEISTYTVTEIDEEAAAYSLELYQNFLECDPEMFLNITTDSRILGNHYALRDEHSLSEEQLAFLKSKAEEITAECTTITDRIYAITEYIAKNICYDHDYYTNHYYDRDQVNENPYDVFTKESAVCSGYANLMVTLLQLLDIPCVYVDSPIHAWNMVYNGERWMLIDATWVSRSKLSEGVLNKSDNLWMKWYDFTIDQANANANHLIESLPYAASDGVLTSYPMFTRQTEVIIPDGITSISPDFWITHEESEFVTVILPSSLSYISEFSFDGSLQKIIFNGTVAEFNAIDGAMSKYNPAIMNCPEIICQDGSPAPAIVSQPLDTLACIDVPVTLSVSIQSYGGSISCQWYQNNVKSNTGGTPITGAASLSYTFTPAETGKSYYYVRVSAGDSDASSVISEAVEVWTFDEVPTDGGYIGPDVRLIVLPNAGITYITGTGEITARFTTVSVKKTKIFIDKEITSIPQNLIDYSIGNASEFVVEEGNARYASDSSGALYDTLEHRLLCFPSYSLLTEFSIMEGTEIIGANAIDSNYLTSLTIPASLTTIEGALSPARRLNSIHVNAGNTSFYMDEGGALINTVQDIIHYCTDPDDAVNTYIMPDGIRSIADKAFYDSDYTRIQFADTVESIGTCAFWGASLTELTLPESVNAIGDLAFAYCFRLTDVYFRGNAPESFGKNVFATTDGFETPVLHYYSGKTGWSTPVWSANGTEYTTKEHSTTRDITLNLTTYGDAADVTIQLLVDDEVIRTETVPNTTGTASFTITGVSPGSYIIRVSKPNHVARSYSVTVQ